MNKRKQSLRNISQFSSLQQQEDVIALAKKANKELMQQALKENPDCVFQLLNALYEDEQEFLKHAPDDLYPKEEIERFFSHKKALLGDRA